MPGARGNGFGGGPVVARQHHDRFDAERLQLTNRLSRFRSNGVRERDEAADVVVAADDHDRLARRAPLFERLVKLRTLLRSFFQVPVGTEPIIASVDPAVGALARNNLEIRDDGKRNVPAAGVFDNRSRQRMIGVGLQARRAREQLRLCVIGERQDLRHDGSARGQRARLVERDGAKPCRRFDEDAALDQNAVSSGGRERRNDGHRRRDDERAGTADDEQHERTIGPVGPRPRE